MLVGLFLLLIVLANLSVALFGATASIINAFIFIGGDLAIRDKLHEKWKDDLSLNMTLLIVFGGLISFLLNKDAGIIALASLIAFMSASFIDTFVYHLLKDKKYLVKANSSNVFGSMTDSIVFPTIAFGGFNLWITALQFVAKVLGGFIWSLVINYVDANKSPS